MLVEDQGKKSDKQSDFFQKFSYCLLSRSCLERKHYQAEIVISQLARLGIQQQLL